MNPIPKELTPALMAWYQKHKRILPWRENHDPYRIWVSEIMLQQTRVDAVIPYYNRFMERFPTLQDLAEASEEEAVKLWEGLGYYSRIRNLQKGVRKVLAEYGGEVPSDYKELQKIPGIGEYVARAISSIAFGLKNPAVDGNVLRIISRITESDDDIMKQSVRREVWEQLKELYPDEGAGDFTQALMELGAIVCLPNGAPRCDICPVSDLCKARESGSWEYLPVKTPKKERKMEERTLFLLHSGDKWAIQKRPDEGLLASLWEFPSVAGTLSQKEVEEVYGKNVTPWGKAKHIFSHVEWHMTGYFIETEETDDFTWVTLPEMEEVYTIPSAFRYFYKKLKKHG